MSAPRRASASQAGVNPAPDMESRPSMTNLSMMPNEGGGEPSCAFVATHLADGAIVGVVRQGTPRVVVGSCLLELSPPVDFGLSHSTPR